MSAACQRFRASMELDYNQWKEGEPYDIAALADCTPAERDALVTEISARDELDWRDVDALRALATPAAMDTLARAATRGRGSGASEALVHHVQTQGWSPAAEARLIEMLAEMQGMEGSADRLFGLCEAFPTPAVRARLLQNARTHHDPAMRYAAGACLLYLAGHVDSRYVFDTDNRPRLLDLNAGDSEARAAALAWLRARIDNPAA